MGCAVGRLFGEVLDYALKANNVQYIINPGTYALIGATAVLGGVTRMTISLTVILLETTNNIQYLLPIMIVLIISKYIGDLFNISLYDIHINLKHIPFVETHIPKGYEFLRAIDVMSEPVLVLSETESV